MSPRLAAIGRRLAAISRVRLQLALLLCAAACHSAPIALPPPPGPPPPPPPPLPRSTVARSYATLDSGATRLTILLATTRRVVQSDRAGDRYGPDDADSLQFAAVTVNVPPYSARGTGEVPRQSTLSSTFSSAPNPAREFFVSSVIPADSNRFVQRIAADLANTRSRNILVFVHGFNTSFEDAAIRAAQIAADLNFDGTVVLFSWPSAASITSYVRDQGAARNAGFHLLRLLRGVLVAAQPDHIELLGHSMGSETIAKALSHCRNGFTSTVRPGDLRGARSRPACVRPRDTPASRNARNARDTLRFQ